MLEFEYVASLCDGATTKKRRGEGARSEEMASVHAMLLFAAKGRIC